MNAVYDVIVIGGGVIGLAIARQVRTERQKTVLVVDRGPAADAASWAAAGMLTPQSEADSASPFLDLCLASQRMYRAFTDELRKETDIDAGCIKSGLLYLAPSSESFQVCRRRYEAQKQIGLSIEFLSPDELRVAEPEITAPAHCALFFPDDLQVTPRRLTQALHDSCIRSGVEIRSGASVDEISAGSIRIGREELRAAKIVVASGVWSPEVKGLNPPAPVRPRKGQILSLNSADRPLRHMIRWENVYLVPRPNGDLVIGATEEEAGFDRSVTPAGIVALLSKAQVIASRVASLPIKEMWAGLRPATPDGLPIIGKSRLEGVYYATGHYRNGILLAPITAAIIAALVEERTPPLPIDAYSPFRFQ
jgi:glycine oxidase